MNETKKYKRKAGATILAVQFNLEVESFTYEKWGSLQTCKRGDWLVQNMGETYTVDAKSFAQTYQQVGPGVFAKGGFVFAKEANEDGTIATKEGVSAYQAGDVLVFNNEDQTDGDCMNAAKFRHLYESA